MRHRVKGKSLNRSSLHRQALFKNLAVALVTHGRVETTQSKAKILKGHIDKLITKAKQGSLHSRRQLHSVFNRRDITNRLVDHILPQISHRTSGFTKITPLGVRRGDNTMMARIEFVDKITPQLSSSSTKKSISLA